MTGPIAHLDHMRDRCYLVAAPLRMTDIYNWGELVTVLTLMRVGDFVTVERVPDYRNGVR